jgi:hypothetical protein
VGVGEVALDGGRDLCDEVFVSELDDRWHLDDVALAAWRSWSATRIRSRSGALADAAERHAPLAMIALIMP